MRFKKQIYPIFIITCFVLISITLFLFFQNSTPLTKETSPASFEEFTNRLFLTEVTSDTLSLHYTLSNPSHYGITNAPITLPLMRPADTVKQALSLENLLTFLNRIDYSSLQTEYQHTYDILYEYLAHELEGTPYSYFPEPFSPSHGVQSSFPILMAEYAFTSETDIKQYLALLMQTTLYFNSLMNWEDIRADKGYVMPDYSMDKVVAQCNTIITKQSLQENSHFLQISFRNRCQQLVDSGLLTTSTMDTYVETNTKMLTNYVLPAYENLSKYFTKSTGGDRNENGLYYLTSGCDYYAWLLQKNTGSYRTIEEILQLLQNDYQEKSKQLDDLISVYKENPGHADISTSTFALSTPEEMVAHLTHMSEELFPPFPSNDEKTFPAVSVKNVDAALENYTSPAFYMIPPIDNVTNNSIYINQKNAPRGIELYTTLAHEGYPGHLYQTVYYDLYQAKNKLDPIRNVLHFGGYVEGFAIYSESLAYDYASSLMQDTYHTSVYGDLYEILKLSRQTELCLLSMLDICIHYYGITYAQICDTLSAYGVTDEAQSRSIYEYIVEEPTNYLKYYLGYLEIVDLKSEYMSKYEKNADIPTSETTVANKSSKHQQTDLEYAFHKFLLECGPSDFKNLHKRLESEF